MPKIQTNIDISREELVKRMNESLLTMEFGDIKRALLDGKAKMAGFILGCCFIDALAGYYAGVDRKTISKDSSVRFKNFVTNYLRKYDPDKLYKDLRCGLVHSYAEGGTYVFTDGNKVGNHFQELEHDGKTKILLNLEDFIKDIYDSYSLFISDIRSESDQSFYENAKKRYLDMGSMGILK